MPPQRSWGSGSERWWDEKTAPSTRWDGSSTWWPSLERSAAASSWWQGDSWADDSWADDSWEAAPAARGPQQHAGWGSQGGAEADGDVCEDGATSARGEAPSQKQAAKAVEPCAHRPGPIAGKEWPEDEMIAAMDAYYKSLPHDTFCGQASDAHDLPWQWKPKDDQRSLRLPSSCMLRQRLELPQHSEQGIVANIVLKELYKIGEVDENLRPSSSAEPKQPPAVEEKLPFIGKMDDSNYEAWELGRWPADEYVDAHVLVSPHDGSRDFAFVSSMPTRFHYRLRLEDLQFHSKEEANMVGASGPVRLEAAALAWQEDIENDVLARVARDFHAMLTGCSSPIYIACIRITGPGTCIDLETMQQALDCKELPVDTPRWLPELARRVGRLRILEHQIAEYAPVHPAPNPLIMESVLQAGPCRTKDALAMIGEGVVREMAALALYIDYPWDNADRLQRRLEDLVSDKACASWMLGGGSGAGLYLLTECSAVVKSSAEATRIFHALAGAHFLESGPSAVAYLWAWLAKSRDLHSALRHMHTPASFAGRTETYTELHWAKGEQLKEMESFKPHRECPIASLIRDEEEYLFVVYAESDHTLYRKVDRCAEELRHQVAGEKWREIVWDPNLGVFCSPTRKRASPPGGGTGGMQLQPLPNKVTACLYGRSLMAQATLKSKRQPGVPRCVRLKETRKAGPPTLQVVYDDHVQLCYRRDPQGFGIEIGVDSKERQLGYSEVDKTLISPYRKKPLPSLVIEWVCGVQSLVQLVPLPKESAGASSTATPELDTSTKRTCRWPAKDPQYSCKLLLEGGRYVFVGREERRRWDSSSTEEPPWEELWYSKEKSQWLLQVGGQKDTCIPEKAVAKVMESIDDSEWVDALRTDLTRSPWLRCPSLVMRQFISLVPGAGLSEAEKALGHKFSNPSLLVEALTHCSALPDASPSCERLALVGETTVSAYVRLHAADRASIPTTAAAGAGGLLHSECSSLAAPRELVPWQGALERQPGASSADARTSAAVLEESHRRWLACCNHASYARSCVRLGLPSLLRHESSELDVSIQRYVRAAKRSQGASSTGQGPAASSPGPSPPAGAPRVLGDIFLACMGALVLDGQRTKAEEKIQEHVDSCGSFEKGLADLAVYPGSSCPRPLQQAKPSDINAIIGMVVSHAGAAINSLVLAPPPPAPPAFTQKDKEEARAKQEKDFERLQQKVCRNRDVHIIDAELASQGMRPYGGVSPRAAMIHRGRPPEDFGEPEPGEAAAPTEACLPKKDEGAVYCDDCQMWLNGPTQWEDHKIGKKHRKNHGRHERSQKRSDKVDKSGESSEPRAPAEPGFQHQ